VNQIIHERKKMMFFKILKKDLKRSKTMNIILFLFIILATVFVSSGLNNLISVLNGMNYFMDQAIGEKGDYFLMVNQGEDEADMIRALDAAKSIKSYGYDKFFMYNGEVRGNDGKKIDWNGMIMIQSPESSYMKFFDSENNEITKVDKGHIYITKKFFNKYGVEPGDKITLMLGKEKREFILDGPLKDAALGAELTGGDRFFMNEADAKEYFDSEDAKLYNSAFIYIESDDIESINTETKDMKGNEGGYPRSMLVLTRIVDLIVAFIVVILSICLIIVSFVILKFSIGFTIQDDFREIGVMKAIGIRNFKIRTLYLVKYTAIALIGAVIGLIISYPFGKLLLRSVSEGMVLGNSYGNLVNIVGAVLVFVIILWLAFVSTGKVKKLTPVDAIRSGETGERFKKKGGLRISKVHTKNTSYLSWNDILSSPKRYLNIIISFGICTMFMLIVANFTTTLDSPVFADMISYSSDVYMDNEDSEVLDIQSIVDKYPDELKDSDIKEKKELSVSYFAQFEHGKEMYEMYLKLVEDKLADEGMPAKTFNDMIFIYNLKYNGEEYNYSFNQIVGDRYGDYEMIEGSAPENVHEVAITPTVKETFGMDIGDTLEIDYDGEKVKCTVVGVYQSMNNLGNMIRVHEDAPTSLTHYSGCMCTQISFTDNPSQEEIDNRIEKLRSIFDTKNVHNKVEETVKNMGTLDAMKAVEMLLVAITIIVVILVTIMMERSFIAKETKQVAILKAMGFRDREVIKWQVIRFGILAVIAVVIAMALSIPVTIFAGNAIFSMMGASKVGWLFSISSLAKYPLMIVAVTVVITWITSLYTGTVKARDTASIE
jgi:ABC-type transport system, involved in lipoprotein release, permease component